MSPSANNLTPLPQRDPVNIKVARNVRDIMFQRDIKQTQLAIELGLTESQVSRRVSGKVDWTPADIETTARVLRVSVGRLFEELPHLDSNQEPIGLRPVVGSRPVVFLADRRGQERRA